MTHANDWFTDDEAGGRVTTEPTTEPCPECGDRFDGKMPGHVYGSNWAWVPCRTCSTTPPTEPGVISVKLVPR